LGGKSIIKQFIPSYKFTLENIFSKYILCGLVLLLCVTCKKKTSIDVTVFNYTLNEPVANAKVALIESKERGALAINSSCNELTSSISDAEGKCSFDNEKLKTRAGYKYFMAITEAYGKTQNYPCGGKTSGFLKAGTNYNEILDVGAFESFLEIKINGALNPSLLGDSLNISIVNPIYKVPGQPYAFGGGGVASGGYSTESPNYPFPSIISWPIQKTNAGKNTVHIRKRKMGVLTTYVDTVKIYPYETKIIEVNW
jgi:hypothetical protein